MRVRHTHSSEEQPSHCIISFRTTLVKQRTAFASWLASPEESQGAAHRGVLASCTPPVFSHAIHEHQMGRKIQYNEVQDQNACAVEEAPQTALAAIHRVVLRSAKNEGHHAR